MKTATLPKTTALDYERLISALPGLYLVLSPQLRVLEATEAYLQATLTQKHKISGQYFFDIFPENPQAPEAEGFESLQKSLMAVLDLRTPQTLPIQRYDIPRPASLGGGFEERYWLFTNSPVLDANGEILYIIHQVTDVTMQQLANREVHTNRERFDVLAQATNDAIWDWNLLSNDIWWSRGYKTTFGYGLNDRASNFDSWTQLLHPDDYERVVKSIHNVLEQGGKMWSDKFRFRRANGTYAEVIARGIALRDENTIVYRMIGSMLDVTNQLQTDREWAESRQRFLNLLDALPYPAWTTNPEGATTYFNQAWYQLTGMAPGKLKGATAFFHPDDRETLTARWDQCRQDQTPLEIEYRLKDQATDEYTWFRAKAVPVFSQTGEIEQWFGTCTNINEAKKAEEKMLAKDQFLQQMLALSPVNIAVFKGPEHRCEFISPGFKKLQGNREILGKTVAEAWPEMAVQGFISILDTVFATGKPYYGHEFPVFADRYANGYRQEYFFDFHYQPISDGHKRTIGLIATATDVTEQVYAKRAAEALAEKVHTANQRLEETLERLPVMTWTADAEGRATFFSHEWYAFSDKNPENLMDFGWFDLVHPEEKAAVMDLWEHCLETGEAFETQNQWLDANGNYQWFRASAFPIRNPQGFIGQWVGSLSPINTGKELSVKMQEAHSRYQVLTENIPQLVWSAQPDGTIDFLNQRWYDYTGLPQEENIGDTWQRAVHPEELGLVLAQWIHALQTGEEFTLEVRFANGQTGVYNWFLVRGVPVRNVAGDLVKWVGTSTNIQAQKALLEQLQHSQEQFAFLADTIPQLVWTTRPDGFHDYFNRRWTEYTGYILEDSVGDKMWSDLLHPEDRERAIARWQHALQTGEFYEIEYRFKRGKDGVYRWFLGQAMPMRNEAGEIVKWFGTCTDIEDQKQAEANLLAKNEELSRTNEDLDNFVYTASHDLKLPIVNMGRIFGELLETAEFHDPEADKLVGLFNKSLQQIHGTINDLAEVVKVQKNLEESREAVNLQALAEDVTFSIQDLIDSSKAQVQFDFAQAPELWFSKANLKSILYNLLTNSLKYASPERRPEIRISTKPAGKFTLLTVSDNGLGMDLQKHGGKLFQMFKRLHNHVPGSGLGLYILNRIVTANGGKIQVESQVNQGTTFKIYFQNKQQQPKLQEPNQLGLILLLDDDETTNFLNERLLKRMGIAREIRILSNGEAALNYLQRECLNEQATCPDLILMDVKMSVMDGFEFLNEFEAISNEFRKMPQIVMLTSSASPQELEKLKQFPSVKSHFSKPLSEAMVREIIQELKLLKG